MEKNLFHLLDNGILVSAGKKINLGLCAWNKHKDFNGVYMKSLVTAEQTNGLFTCHLVRIEPNHKIGLHTHPSSMELHEVVKGSGICLIDQEEISYTPGVMTVVACNQPHEVRAGNNGLFIFAKFITAPA